MKVYITLDRYDGSQSSAITCYADDFPMSDLMWRMMEPDVSGFTVTKAKALPNILDKMTGEKE